MRFLLIICFVFCGLDAFAQGPNPQVGMRVGGSKNPNQLCEGDTLWLTNLTQDSSRTVSYYIFNWNWKDEVFYPKYRDTLYNKDSIYHIYRFHDTIVYKNCKERSKKLYVSLTAVDTFQDEFEIVSNIVMYLEPRSSFSGPPNACLGDDVTFTSSSCPIDTSIDFYWEIEGKSYFTANVTHKFTTPGRHKIKLTQTSGNPCPKADSTISYIDIYEYPIPDMLIQTLRKNNTFCFGKDTLKLINQSTRYTSIVWNVAPADSMSLKWIAPTHSSSDTARILPLQLGRYSVQLTAFNYVCRDTTKTTFFDVIVSPEVKIKKMPVCMADTGIVLSKYLDTSNGLPDAYFWKLTGPGTLDSGNAIPNTARTLNYGKHYFQFHSNGICDTFHWIDSFFVMPSIHKLRDSLSLCNGSDTLISLNSFFSSLPSSFGTRWMPDSLITGTSFNPFGKSPGKYRIFLSDSNSSCFKDSLTFFLLAPDPQHFPDTLVCIQTDTFVLIHKDPGLFSGPGLWGSKFIPIAAGAGLKNIIFYTDSTVLCPYTDTFQIEVSDTFDASFFYSPVLCAGKASVFINRSGTRTQFWDFGDNTFSSDSLAVKTYSSPGTYQVLLTAGKFPGCVDTVSRWIQVIDTPSLSFGITVDSSTCDSFFVHAFLNQHDSALRYAWTINGDSLFSDSIHAGFKKLSTESYLILSAFSMNDCETKKDSVLIRIPPVFNTALSLSGPTKKCTPFEASFGYNIYGHYDSFQVDYGNGIHTFDTLIDVTFFNPVTADTQYLVKITSWSSKCGISTDSILLVVAPNNIHPSFTINTPGCKNGDFNFVNTSTDSIEIWQFGDGKSSTLQNPVHQYTTIGNYFAQAIYKAPFGCTDTLLKHVVVYENPTLKPIYALDTSGCDTAAIALRIQQPDSAQAYVWETGLGSFNGDTLFQMVPRLEKSDSFWSFKVIGTNICGSAADSAVLRIPPKFHAKINLKGPSKFCTPYTASFAYGIYGLRDSFHVDYGNGQTAINALPDVTFYNSGNTDTTYIVRITAWSAQCGISTDSVQVVVAPNLIQPAFTVNNPGCRNSDFNFVNTSTDSVETWFFGDGKSSVLQNPVHQYTGIGEFDALAVFTAPFGCKDSLTRKIIVYEGPKLTDAVQLDTSACDTALVILRIVQPDTAQNYIWVASGDTLIGDTALFKIARNQKYDSLWKYKVQGTNICGTVSDSAVIRIPPKFHARLGIVGPSKSCTPFTAAFQYEIYGLNDSFHIDYGNGQTSVNSLQKATYYNSSTTDSQYVVRITAFNGLCGIAQDSVIVTVAPNNIQPSFNTPYPGCINGNTAMVNTSSDSVKTWYFGTGDSSLMQSPNYVYKKTGLYTITAVYKAPWSCTDTLRKPIRIIEPPHTGHTYLLDSNFCDSVLIYVEVNQPDTLNQYLWNAGGGYTSNQWKDTFVILKKFLPYFQPMGFGVSNVCGSAAFNDSFYISTKFSAHVVINGLNNGCSPFVPTLDNLSTGKVRYFRVDYGNGDTSINRIKPVLFYNTTPYAISYPVVLTAYNEYCDSLRDTTLVWVNPVSVKPYAEYAKSTYCRNETVTFINNSSPEADVRIFWGDGNVTSNIRFGDTLKHVYPNPGTYNVTVEARSCGKDTSVDYPITIEDYPSPDFKIEPGTICSHEWVKISNTSANKVLLWRIQGKDTAMRQDSLYARFSGIGNQSIELVATSASGVCRDSVKRWYQVHEPGQITWTADTLVNCVPHRVCVNVGGNVSNYLIRWGDGNLGGNCHTYTKPDTFKILITGTTSNGCPASDSFNIFTHPALPSGMKVTVDSSYCDKIRVIAEPTYKHPLLRYNWQLDNLTDTASVLDKFIPKWPWNSESYLQLTISNLCGSVTFRDTFETGKQTLARLGLKGANRGCSPFTTEFIHLSAGFVDSFEIDYGDGSKTINTAGIKTFVNNSETMRVIRVILKVFNPGCPPETDTQYITVFPNRVQLGAEFSQTTYCHGQTVEFINRSTDQASLSFHYGDGTQQSGVFTYGDIIRHTYSLPGTYNISVKSASPCLGDSVFLQSVQIIPPPTVDFDIDRDPACNGTDIQFFNRSEPLSNLRWIVNGTDSFDNIQPLVYQFSVPGIQSIELKGTSPVNGCFGSKTKTFNILPRTDYRIDLDTPICTDQTTCLHIRGDVSRLNIDWGNGTFGSETDTCRRYENPGTYQVKLDVYNGVGCLEKVNRDVLVYPPPIVTILPDADFVNLELGRTLPLDFDRGQAYRRYYWINESDTLCTDRDTDCSPLNVGPFGNIMPMRYTLLLTDPRGCFGSDKIDINLTSEGRYFVPNAFSPSIENKLNNTFRPHIVDARIDRYEMYIFNRWGEILFHQDDLKPQDSGWDGYYKEDLCEPEVYGVLIIFKGSNNYSERYKGYMMLMR